MEYLLKLIKLNYATRANAHLHTAIQKHYINIPELCVYIILVC